MKTLTDLQRSLAESEDQKDRLWTEVKVLLDEFGLLKTDMDTMEHLLQQHVPEIYGSVVIQGKRHGHVLVRSLSELKEHVFGDQKLPEHCPGSGGGLRSLHNAPELSLQAPRDVPSTVATIHENIMKQSQLVLNNIDPVDVSDKPCGPVVNWQDVCQSIASQLVSESDMASRVPLDSAKVMPLFDIMLKELDISKEPTETIRVEPPQCLPKQVLGLAKTMETELDMGSTNGSSTQSMSTHAFLDSVAVKSELDDRSSNASDRSPVDTERVNREYEELKKKRLHLLIQAYTGNPDPDSLIARARSQVSVLTHSSVDLQVASSAREMEAMKKLEASRARMYAMKEKLRLGQPLYHIASDDVPEGDASESLLGGNFHRRPVPEADASQSLLDVDSCRRPVIEADASQSLLDVNSRRRLVEAMSAQEMAPPVVQRQSMVWKKTIAPSNEDTRPSCYFSAPLMSSSPRGEMAYAEGAQRLQNPQSIHHQRHRQIYPHKKGYKTAEQFADGEFIGEVECSSYADLMMDNGLKYPRGNSEVWIREKRGVPSGQDDVCWTQRAGCVATENCGDLEYDDTLNRSAESLVSQRDDDVYDWRRQRQTQSCWNLTNTSKGVTSRHVMPVPDHCQSLTLHSQSLVDISCRQVLADASDTDSRLDTSARSATELHCTDTSLQESDRLDTSAYSDESALPHTQDQQPRRLPDNVYHVQERYREESNCVRVDDQDYITDRRNEPTFERARDERLKTYAKHDSLGGVCSDTLQQGHQDFLADNAPKPGNANWTSYYQRRCRGLKDPTEEVVSPASPDPQYRISSESKQFVSKDVRNGDVSGGDEAYNSRLAVRDNLRQSDKQENIRAPNTGSEPRGKSVHHVASREPCDSPRDNQTISPGYSRDDSPKTVTFSDGDTRRRLTYPDTAQRGPRDILKTTTFGHVNYQKNRKDKCSDTNGRAKNRCWSDDGDVQVIRTSYTGSWRDKEEDVGEDVLREPPSHVNGPLKEQHVQMLNTRRLSVHRDDDSSTSMSDVDFVVMRSGDIVRRRKKAKGRKKDAPETSTRGARAEQLVDNDRESHQNLDIIAEGKKCLEEEQDYLGDYRSLQLLPEAVKAEKGDWSELKARVGISSAVRSSEDPDSAESRRRGVSKPICVNEKTTAGAAPVKRSAAAALQLERDLVAAGRLMEEIEKCKLVSLTGEKRQSDTVMDDSKLKTETNVITVGDAKLEYSERQNRGLCDKKKLLSSIVECPSEDVTEKKEGDALTSSEVTEKVADVPEQ